MNRDQGEQMFKSMRRHRQALAQEEILEILERNTSGVLSLLGEDDYPYGVPLNYVYDKGRLLFHSAKNGHKISAISHHEKASFCVIDQDQIVPEEYTSYFRSAIVFGKMCILEDEREIYKAIDLLAKKYRPGFEEERKQYIEKDFPNLLMLELRIEHWSGKVATELL